MANLLADFFLVFASQTCQRSRTHKEPRWNKRVEILQLMSVKKSRFCSANSASTNFVSPDVNSETLKAEWSQTFLGGWTEQKSCHFESFFQTMTGLMLWSKDDREVATCRNLYGSFWFAQSNWLYGEKSQRPLFKNYIWRTKKYHKRIRLE